MLVADHGEADLKVYGDASARRLGALSRIYDRPLITRFANQLGDHALLGKVAAMNGLLAIHKPIVNVYVEDTASPLYQRHLCRWEGLPDLCLHPGGMWLIVSDYAVCDRDSHVRPRK